MTTISIQASRAKLPRFARLNPDAPAGSVVTEERRTIALPPQWWSSVVRWKAMGVPDLLFDKAVRIAMEKRDIRAPKVNSPTWRA